MNGYGQPIEMQAALQQAMADYEKVQRRQEALQRAASSGNGYQLLGAALGGLAANKFGLDPAEVQKRLIDEQFKYEQAQQAAMAQKQAQMEAQKRAEAQAEYERERRDKLEDFNRQQAGKKEMFAYQQQFKQPEAPSVTEQQWALLSPEQKQQAAMAANGLGQSQTPYDKQTQYLIDTNQITQQQADNQLKDKALGVKPDKELGEGTRQKLSFIKNAREKLSKYKEQAFKDGDYQEMGSMFGNTNNLLSEAVRNKLRAESGAQISDEELSSELDLFSPSMFRSDKTNLQRVNELEETLKRLESELVGGKGKQKQSSNFDQQNQTLFKYSQ